MLRIPSSIRGAAMTSLVVGALAATGCAQGVGQRCQLDSDCATNLICTIPAGVSRQIGGTCEPATADAGIAADLSPPTSD